MTLLLFVAVALAGGVGAGLRYAVDVGVTRMLGAAFPWGILVVNVTGSFVLGVLTGLTPPGELAWVVGVGLLGGYTTFSAVAVTTVLLAEEARPARAALYALGTLLASVAAAGVGLWLGSL